LAIVISSRLEKTLNPDWLQGVRQRIGIAITMRYMNARRRLGIVLVLFTGLLERLEAEQKIM
jgi:hypothetical protein